MMDYSDRTDQKTQDYHAAIKNVVEHLKSKRSVLIKEITTDELEKAKVVEEMNKLQNKLSILNANLRKKSEFRKEYDKAISQSEEHFVELLQKSEDFLSLTRREALALSTVISETQVASDQAPVLQEPKNLTLNTSGPPAVVAIQPPTSGSCAGCTNASPCATIMVPYRANGL